jgi:hypothetical protein
MTTKLNTPEGRNEREGDHFGAWEGYAVAAIIVITNNYISEYYVATSRFV